jgi:hypothetical protein
MSERYLVMNDLSHRRSIRSDIRLSLRHKSSRQFVIAFALQAVAFSHRLLCGGFDRPGQVADATTCIQDFTYTTLYLDCLICNDREVAGSLTSESCPSLTQSVRSYTSFFSARG